MKHCQKKLFYPQMSQLCSFVQFARQPKAILNDGFSSKGTRSDTINLPLRFTFSKILAILTFHVVILQRTAKKKCRKIQNARAEPLFCSLNLLFGDVLDGIGVVVC